MKRRTVSQYDENIPTSLLVFNKRGLFNIIKDVDTEYNSEKVEALFISENKYAKTTLKEDLLKVDTLNIVFQILFDIQRTWTRIPYNPLQ